MSRPSSPTTTGQMSQEQAEQQLNQLVSEIRILETYHNEIVSRIEAASAGLSDSRSAIQAIDALAHNSNGEFMFPIGGGLLLPVNNLDVKKLILSIGAGVAIEKDLDSARVFLQGREKEFEKALASFEQQRKEVSSRLEAGRTILQQLTGQG